MEIIFKDGIVQIKDKIEQEIMDKMVEKLKEEAGYKWISVKDSLPEPLETVFISNGKGWTTLGCITELFDKGDGSSWCWAQSNGIIYEENGKIVAECEDDDLDVQYWHRLPNPPKP